MHFPQIICFKKNNFKRNKENYIIRECNETDSKPKRKKKLENITTGYGIMIVPIVQGRKMEETI